MGSSPSRTPTWTPRYTANSRWTNVGTDSLTGSGIRPNVQDFEKLIYKPHSASMLTSRGSSLKYCTTDRKNPKMSSTNHKAHRAAAARYARGRSPACSQESATSWKADASIRANMAGEWDAPSCCVPVVCHSNHSLPDRRPEVSRMSSLVEAAVCGVGAKPREPPDHLWHSNIKFNKQASTSQQRCFLGDAPDHEKSIAGRPLLDCSEAACRKGCNLKRANFAMLVPPRAGAQHSFASFPWSSQASGFAQQLECSLL